MKNKLHFWLIIGCLVFLAACSSDDDYQIITPKFDILRSDNIDLSGEGGMATVEFTSEGVEVKASVNVDWCRIEEVAANKVTLSVDANEDLASRSAIVSLTDGETTRQVAILQTGAIWIYDRDETTLYVDETAKDVIVKMSGTFPFELSIPQSVSGWLSGAVTKEGFKLKVKENITGARRTASFKVKMKDRIVEYTVVQYVVDDLMGTWGGQMLMAAPDLEIDETTVNLTGSQILKIGKNNYYILLPLRDLGDNIALELIATYRNGKFTVTAPQQQGIMLSGSLFGSIIIASPQGMYLQGDIVLSPEIRKGVITYSYDDEFYLLLGFFGDKEPTVNNYKRLAIEFPELSLQKSLK